MEASTEEPKHGVRRRRRSRRRGDWLKEIPLAVFAIIVCGGPLLFGAVDRWVQIGLVALLATGCALRPPSALPARSSWVLLGVAAMLAVAQFGPWHASSEWRRVVEGELRVNLPFTSHPEPARAIDALLAGAIAVLWFLWVRGISADRQSRVRMFWVMIAAGVAIAAVCLAVKGTPSGKIYGLRPTLGWVGWGPFPNRNHTADFLAMAALVSMGAICWSVAKRRKFLAIVASASFMLVVTALLLSKSRGGLVAFGAGMAVFMVAILARHRDRRAWGAVIGLGLVTGALVLAFGGKVLERFTSREAGAVSNDLRRQIWSDTVSMWRDAPVFGHGLETFPQLFPVYTTHDFDGQTVRHSESSWLLWLSEIGALPLAILTTIIVVLVVRGTARAWRDERKSFYLTAGALAAVAALTTHAVFDVPGHRWGTAGFALALLAVSIPPRTEKRLPRIVALVPLVLAAYWALPYLTTIAWSPTHLARLEARESASNSPYPIPQVPSSEWEKVLRHFPLDPAARLRAGVAALGAEPPNPAAAHFHFAVSRRLAGSSWGYPMLQARAYRQHFPGDAIVAWQDAIDRSGRRRADVLRAAVTETAEFPGFWVLWGEFIERRPELALSYARALIEETKAPPEQVRYYFDLWRSKRAGAKDLPESEIADFYVVARSFGNPALLAEWMEAHKHRWATDYKEWVALFANWGDFEQAWRAFARVNRDTTLGEPPAGTNRPTLESQHRASPENSLLALSLAQHFAREGDQGKAEEVILRHAQRKDAPIWFIRKAAHILAGRGDYKGAVALVTREK